MPTILFIPRIPLPIPAGRSTSSKIPVCPDCGTAVDPAARTCVGCGRVIERPVASSTSELPPTTVLSPTAAGAWLILAVLLVVVVGGPIYWWRTQFAHVPKAETEFQLKARLQAEAEVEMFKEATNAVIGLTRIIHSVVSNTDDNPYKWTGDVTAEFVNRVGGIERTNVYFKFGTDTGVDGVVHLWCGSESDVDRKSRQRKSR